MKNRKFLIIAITIFSCTVMALVDAVIQPGYFIKSMIKMSVFLIFPLLYSFLDTDFKPKSFFKFNKKGILTALVLGVSVYTVILLSFFIFKNVFDFSSLTKSLTATTGVNKSNFIFVALYISFVNSLLEEFFFRGFSFLSLKDASGRVPAYIISSFLFAVYHIAMMIGWFEFPVTCLALLGLFLGGIIFNFFNEKHNNIYPSWLIHMFANFATNTIGFILFNT